MDWAQTQGESPKCRFGFLRGWLFTYSLQPIHLGLWELTRSWTYGTLLHLEILALAVQDQHEKGSLCFYAWPTTRAVKISKMHLTVCLLWCPCHLQPRPTFWLWLTNIFFQFKLRISNSYHRVQVAACKICFIVVVFKFVREALYKIVRSKPWL